MTREMAFGYALWAAAGLAVGSFLNVVIHRVPHGLSVIRPRSFCPTCHARIAWRDNIPLLSYLALRARCRACGHRISLRYPVVEAVAGAFVLLVVSSSSSDDLACRACLAAFMLLLLAVAVIDIEHQVIPDELSAALIVAACLGVLVCHAGLGDALVGGVLGPLSLWAVGAIYRQIRHRDGLGLGDVKLLCSIGIMVGGKGVFVVIAAAALLGCLGALVLASRGRISRWSRVPFAPFLAAATILRMLTDGHLGHWKVG